MKLNNIIAAFLTVSTLFLGSCYGDFDPVAEKVSGNLVANYTIDSLIKTYVSPIGDLPTRIPGLFSVDTIPSNKD